MISLPEIACLFQFPFRLIGFVFFFDGISSDLDRHQKHINSSRMFTVDRCLEIFLEIVLEIALEIVLEIHLEILVIHLEILVIPALLKRCCFTLPGSAFKSNQSKLFM